ncbi:helix-turn-helix transcriptional regulator (plasmid) [Streptomyces sp. BI20]|uniref:helix-turn-helix transcriptional regulator n=1 Tax=Streptomyces sp. BI20 TaxID=3403460 RepID=UPI003C79650F
MPQELFGRNEEAGIITGVLDSARAGSGAVALVEGFIGTGKTSLLRWAEETARERSMIVLSATASATEERFPLGVVHQLLGTLPETARGWERAFASCGAGPNGAPVDPDYPLLAELFSALAGAARRAPVLLTVDCVQHADRQSLLWLGFLARRLEHLPVALVATKRCGEPTRDPHLLVEFGEGIRPDRHIHLHDLSTSAAVDLAAALGDHGRESVDALIADTGGNPYLLTERLRTTPAGAGGETPEGVGADGRRPLPAVRERILCLLRRLDPHGLDVARAVSALTGPVDVGLLARLCGVSAQDACRCLNRLTESGLLDPHDTRFRHPLLAGLLYQDIPCAERAELHRAAARCLRERGAPAPEVAAHLVRAHRLDEPWMAPLLLDVARGALGRDPAGARRLIEKAVLYGGPEADGDAEGLRIEALTSLDLPAAARALTAHAAGARDPGERLRRSLRLADALLRLDEPTRARRVLEEVRREDVPRDPAELARLHRALTHLRLHEGTAGAPAPEAGTPEAGTPEADGTPDGLGARGPEGDRLERVLLARTAAGDSAPAVRRIADRILSVPRAPHGSPSWYHALLALLWAGDVDGAGRHMAAEVRLARAEGAVPRLAEALAVRALVRLHRGALAEAEHDAREAAELLTRIGAGRHHVGALARSVLIDVALEKDDVARAGALVDEVPVGAGDRPGTWWHLHLAHSAARALGRLGKAPQGLALIGYVAEELARRGVVNPAVLPWRSTRAALEMELRDVTGARRTAREETELARRWDAPFALGRALVAQAAAGTGQEALRWAGQAADLLEPEPAPLLFAQALFAAGCAHRRGGRAGRARELLHRANEVGISLGADGLVRAVQRELRDAGGRPDPRKASAESLLTPTERLVSDLAARGMSNRSIARSLKVSLRNVESHLTHSYRKLRISGRAELTLFFPSQNTQAPTTPAPDAPNTPAPEPPDTRSPDTGPFGGGRRAAEPVPLRRPRAAALTPVPRLRTG